MVTKGLIESVRQPPVDKIMVATGEEARSANLDQGVYICSTGLTSDTNHNPTDQAWRVAAHKQMAYGAAINTDGIGPPVRAVEMTHLPYAGILQRRSDAVVPFRRHFRHIDKMRGGRRCLQLPLLPFHHHHALPRLTNPPNPYICCRS